LLRAELVLLVVGKHIIVVIAPGEHVISVMKKGFKKWERKMKTSSGSTNINAELETDAAVSEAKTEPAKPDVPK
jgi:hypothetical protein